MRLRMPGTIFKRRRIGHNDSDPVGSILDNLADNNNIITDKAKEKFGKSGTKLV